MYPTRSSGGRTLRGDGPFFELVYVAAAADKTVSITIHVSEPCEVEQSSARPRSPSFVARCWYYFMDAVSDGFQGFGRGYGPAPGPPLCSRRLRGHPPPTEINLVLEAVCRSAWRPRSIVTRRGRCTAVATVACRDNQLHGAPFTLIETLEFLTVSS